MTQLTTKGRKRIPDKEFGLPDKRAYPVEDKAHARNAKARASEEYNKGNLSKADEERIDRAANRKLHSSSMKEHEHYEHVTKKK